MPEGADLARILLSERLWAQQQVGYNRGIVTALRTLANLVATPDGRAPWNSAPWGEPPIKCCIHHMQCGRHNEKCGLAQCFAPLAQSDDAFVLHGLVNPNV